MAHRAIREKWKPHIEGGPSKNADDGKQTKSACTSVHLQDYSNPLVEGKYVVLQFEQSQKYFAIHKNKPDKLILKKGGWNPENAENIKTTADRRVSLMKPPSAGSRDLLFASRGDSRHVITVSQNTRFAELEDQGTGSAIEAQLFQLEYPLMRRAQGSSESTVGALEIVPFTLKPVEGADEHSDQQGGQIEQLQD